MYALNVAQDGRVLSATEDQYGPNGQPRVEGFPDGDISEYRLVDGVFVYDPVPPSNALFPPSQAEINAANIDYLAMMTGVEL